MANTSYVKFKEALLKAEIDFLNDDIKVVCVDGATYTPNFSTDEFLDDIPIGERVATSSNLTNKTTTNGVFDADDLNIPAVTGDTFEYIVFYKDTGSAATSPLLFCYDTGTGLPFTPSGGAIIVAFSPSGIYALN
jgi:hypothetical protein